MPRLLVRQWVLTVPKAALLPTLLSIRLDLGPARILQ